MGNAGIVGVGSGECWHYVSLPIFYLLGSLTCPKIMSDSEGVTRMLLELLLLFSTSVYASLLTVHESSQHVTLLYGKISSPSSKPSALLP